MKEPKKTKKPKVKCSTLKNPVDKLKLELYVQKQIAANLKERLRTALARAENELNDLMFQRNTALDRIVQNESLIKTLREDKHELFKIEAAHEEETLILIAQKKELQQQLQDALRDYYSSNREVVRLTADIFKLVNQKWRVFIAVKRIYNVTIRTLIEASIVAAACGSIAVLFYVVMGVLAQ